MTISRRKLNNLIFVTEQIWINFDDIHLYGNIDDKGTESLNHSLIRKSYNYPANLH